uniref:J domain-containing protein n=1 Tax=Mucochytrium quahogii TaxID=96639 RepID=A0A7S2RA25_9STRA|mmetsp:Transcript_18276/g.29736  ORF Transcript_18276/g.29736 Transcript_18276/m.29736 type:complete len:181 (+) Transcript_18276:71-613(+)|eukprot:CAMPEP_0203744026 /NCGR_PEP_ID=MMETSP0098-20131031/238_1 /ASSEMBLY_ACC=CAM_ASM_000208 /TAXON_ID=96639 /ORGANISM=" , Strain NY0313808BC1" /LENGTH=180 /DNA_ID=CAMNT_0050631437 /DNA_START=188 /DNA_END=730 /DNA_ORIENTATION=+
MVKTHYEILGLPETCSTEEVKAAFRKMALETHPDTMVPDAKSPEVDTKQFLNVSKAVDILSDPFKRSEYDDSMGITRRRMEARMKKSDSFRQGASTSSISAEDFGKFRPPNHDLDIHVLREKNHQVPRTQSQRDFAKKARQAKFVSGRKVLLFTGAPAVAFIGWVAFGCTLIPTDKQNNF